MLKELKLNNPFRGFRQASGIEKTGILIGFLLVENNITMLPNVGSLYYLFMLLALVYVQSRETISCDSYAMLGLYLACSLSILGNNIPEFFHPWERLATFILITALVSPTITSDAFTQFRTRTLLTIVQLLQYVVIASFIYALMGGGYTRIYFQGVTNHSMMMGPFAALSVLYCICHFLTRTKGRKVKWWYGVSLLCSLFCLLQAASRTSFLSTILSVIVFLSVYYRNAIGKYIRVVAAASLVLVLTYPIWRGYMDKLQMKNQGQISELSVNSREDHWKQRLAEFKSNPINGIGFSSIDTDASSMGSNFGQDGKVETGSSWLAVLSMTGLTGFAFFIVVFAFAFKKAMNLWYGFPLLSAFLIANLCFWICHMMAEGYILAGGNSLAFCVWLTLGVIYGVSNNEYYASKLQQKLTE